MDDETFYTVEELLAMLLNNSRNLAVEFAQDPISNVIVTIPGYFNQAERRAVMSAVEMRYVRFCAVEIYRKQLALAIYIV